MTAEQILVVIVELYLVNRELRQEMAKLQKEIAELKETQNEPNKQDKNMGKR